jgi:hypothetical protein
MQEKIPTPMALREAPEKKEPLSAFNFPLLQKNGR